MQPHQRMRVTVAELNQYAQNLPKAQAAEVATLLQDAHSFTNSSEAAHLKGDINMGEDHLSTAAMNANAAAGIIARSLPRGHEAAFAAQQAGARAQIALRNYNELNESGN